MVRVHSLVKELTTHINDNRFKINNGVIKGKGYYLISFGSLNINDNVLSGFPIPDNAFDENILFDNYYIALSNNNFLSKVNFEIASSNLIHSMFFISSSVFPSLISAILSPFIIKTYNHYTSKNVN